MSGVPDVYRLWRWQLSPVTGRLDDDRAIGSAGLLRGGTNRLSRGLAARDVTTLEGTALKSTTPTMVRSTGQTHDATSGPPAPYRHLPQLSAGCRRMEVGGAAITSAIGAAGSRRTTTSRGCPMTVTMRRNTTHSSPSTSTRSASTSSGSRSVSGRYSTRYVGTGGLPRTGVRPPMTTVARRADAERQAVAAVTGDERGSSGPQGLPVRCCTATRS